MLCLSVSSQSFSREYAQCFSVLVALCTEGSLQLLSRAVEGSGGRLWPVAAAGLVIDSGAGHYPNRTVKEW